MIFFQTEKFSQMIHHSRCTPIATNIICGRSKIHILNRHCCSRNLFPFRNQTAEIYSYGNNRIGLRNFIGDILIFFFQKILWCNRRFIDFCEFFSLLIFLFFPKNFQSPRFCLFMIRSKNGGV